ncbi:MAG: tRNA (adenine-N1)-methyltransferase [Candidatus Pacearchaeota archaeon]|nr:tRNA (adenine-N1)-methyltransferase [Candidatus Pacearchaeota archaeon]
MKEGELVMLVDTKKRKYLIVLKKNSFFEFHKGKISHDDLLRKSPGEKIISSKGEELLILKPALFDFVLKKMKRISQVIYPKDIGQILILGDIFPGAKVLEAGTGSGALTCFLVRAVGEKGKVVSVDERKDMIETAKKNIETFYNKKVEEIKHLKLERANLKDVKEKEFDRVILDLPDPWNYLLKIKKVLKQGGILICWLPTVLQIFKLIEEVEKKFYKNFELQGIYETLQREWQKKGRSLRPKDLMVGHTGFLIIFYKIK